MNFVLYTNMEALPERARALFSASESLNLFLSEPWIETLAATTPGLALACVEDGEATYALLPLVKQEGGHYAALKHRYTSLYSLLLVEDNRQAVLGCLVAGLASLRVRALLLEPVAADDARMNELQHCMEGMGYRCQRYFRFYNWVLRVQGQTFEQYMSRRPSRLRNTLVRKRRKLQREHGCEFQLYTGADVPPAMPDYHAVYGSSWKAREQYGDLLSSVVERFSRRGWTRLAVCYIAGQPAAAQLWFVVNDKASIFRLAYDENWKQYSPGSLLTADMMEHMINGERVQEIDFLTGNEAYKQDWMSERRERWALSCVSSLGPSGVLGRLKAHLGRWFPA